MEITNKTLAILLVAAVAVSLFGIVMTLNKVSSITGYATSAKTGTATLNVSSTTSIAIKQSAINFGSGTINTSGGYTSCTLYVNGTQSAPTRSVQTPNCIGFTSTSSAIPFVIENDGNVNVSVVVKSNATVAQFIGGSGTGGHPVAEFQFMALNNETNSCATGLNNTWSNISTSDVNICSQLFWDGTDTIAVGLRLLIPDDAIATGTRQATITFTGTG